MTRFVRLYRIRKAIGQAPTRLTNDRADSLTGAANSIGIFNTFVGEASGLNHTTGAFNTFIGRFLLVLSLATVGAVAVSAQTTSFTYQGRLTDGGTAANGNYDLVIEKALRNKVGLAARRR